MKDSTRLKQAIGFELKLFKKQRALVLAAIGMMFVPAIYAGIYLSSVWDPYGNFKNLPVAYVNADAGLDYRGQKINLGSEVMRQLEAKHAFFFKEYKSGEAARAAVQGGESYFAVMIPVDFSARAVPGYSQRPGELTVYLSEGTNFMAATIGRRFGSEVAHQLNETLNRKRWEILLEKIGQTTSGVRQLREGSKRLLDGARELNQGSRLLTEKQGELTQGLEKLLDGARRIKAGEQEMREKVSGIPLVGGKIGEGARKLAEGMGQLEDGLERAGDGSRKLAEGAARLADGTARISAGLELLHSKIPARVDEVEGDAEGLAASIESVNQLTAPVANNGSAFAPYFIALSLWVGAVMTTFLLQFRIFVEALRPARQWIKLLAKYAAPSVIVAGQALIMTLAMRFGLGLPIPNLFVFWLIATGGSLTFLAIVLALMAIVGDAGKLVAVILLIFQLASAGGAFPVELSGGIFLQAHPFLPLTDILKAFRASLFGAYDARWGIYLLRLMATGGVAWGIALFAGHRWKYVSESNYRPAIEF